MKTFNSISAFHSSKKTIITIGTFDGVHIGHQKILERVNKEANETDYESVVLTFFPHPRMILDGTSNIKLLNTIEEKKVLFEKIGLNNLIIHPFDSMFSQLTAEEFVKTILVEKLNIGKIIIGHDHRFGKNRSAGIDDLIIFGKKYNFEVEQISVEELNDIAISSTKIRNAIVSGNISLAKDSLGYNYFFSGVVVKGKQLGRTIGFPTANIKIEDDYKLLPKNGVYIVKSEIEKKNYFGMMNIGNRPTIDGKNQTIEIHFLDFNAIIYNSEIRVEILSFIREEIKFESLEFLKTQIDKDRITTLDFIANL